MNNVFPFTLVPAGITTKEEQHEWTEVNEEL